MDVRGGPLTTSHTGTDRKGALQGRGKPARRLGAETPQGSRPRRPHGLRRPRDRRAWCPGAASSVIAGTSGPGRPDVGCLGLKRQPYPADGCAELHPVGLVLLHWSSRLEHGFPAPASGAGLLDLLAGRGRDDLREQLNQLALNRTGSPVSAVRVRTGDLAYEGRARGPELRRR
jgi:hypothetical protein